MINNVVLVGRLTAAPDLRKTPNGVSSLQGALAVNRNFKNQNGEREADFINFQAWRGTADIISQYCDKGALIGITGRLQVRNYEKNGERRYVTYVIAETVTLLEKRNNNQNSNPSNGYNSPFAGANQLDLADDDFPF